MPRKIRSNSFSKTKNKNEITAPRHSLIRYGKTKSHDIPCLQSFSEIEKERIKNSNNVYVDPSGELHCLLCIRQHHCNKDCPCKNFETFTKYDILLKHIQKIHKDPSGDKLDNYYK